MSDTIDFINIDYVTDIVSSYSTTPHSPGLLCIVSPSTLLYEYKANRRHRVQQLDCTNSPSPSIGMTGITVTFTIRRMCALRHEGDIVVLTAGNFAVSDNRTPIGIRAYSMASGELKWQFTGGIPRCLFMSVDEVWMDGSGTIRLCNYGGKEVCRLSMCGGFLGVTFMDSLVGNVGKQRFRDPRMMRRCATTSNVIITDKKTNETWQINILEERRKWPCPT